VRNTSHLELRITSTCLSKSIDDGLADGRTNPRVDEFPRSKKAVELGFDDPSRLRFATAV
jgi:hypothetical protein